MKTGDLAADVVDRLWRAYAPFPRGRNTSGDLTSMLAILITARFVESVGEPSDEFVTRWARAVAEVGSGISPLIDLRAAMMSASRDVRFPLPDIRSLAIEFLDDDATSDDMPWAAAFFKALVQDPTPAKAGWLEVCELFLERHVQESTMSAAEFYTPRTVTQLLTELADPRPGDRILDPACGSGSLLATAARRVAGRGRVDGASFEAYATDRSNPPLAMMNLAIHGVDRPVVRASDPASQFQSGGNGPVEIVLGNPPFNQRVNGAGVSGWPFGTPPESNANFAWLQLAWSRLSDSGTAMMVMPPRAAWSGGPEAGIRKQMIAGGALRGIIALPPNLFPHTSVAVHVWMLARDGSRHLPTDDTNAVLVIDASRLGTQPPRRPRVLTEADIGRITDQLEAWRRSPRTSGQRGFSRSVTREEILENGGNVDPRLYIEADRERPAAPDTSEMLDDLDLRDHETARSSVGIRDGFDRCTWLSRNETEPPPHVPLASLVKDGMRGAVLAGPSGSLLRANDYVNTGGVPVVMPQDLTNSGFSTARIRQVDARHAESLDRFRLRDGDVVLARRGELGRCAVVGEAQQGWICGTGCFVLRPPDRLDADYFAAYLRSAQAREWLDSHSTGSVNMKTISRNVLLELPVVLPPLETQRAIAEMTSRLDEHERLLRMQLDLTQKIRSDALTGLLASHGSSDASA